MELVIIFHGATSHKQVYSLPSAWRCSPSAIDGSGVVCVEDLVLFRPIQASRTRSTSRITCRAYLFFSKLSDLCIYSWTLSSALVFCCLQRPFPERILRWLRIFLFTKTNYQGCWHKSSGPPSLVLSSRIWDSIPFRRWSVTGIKSGNGFSNEWVSRTRSQSATLRHSGWSQRQGAPRLFHETTKRFLELLNISNNFFALYPKEWNTLPALLDGKKRMVRTSCHSRHRWTWGFLDLRQKVEGKRKPIVFKPCLEH